MIHRIKTPHRWITPPWDLIFPDILHSITWVPSDDSIGPWAKRDHDVPQNKFSTPSSTFPLHPSDTSPQKGGISQKDTGRGRIIYPYKTVSYHHSYAGSCSISTERYLQKQDFGVNNREETWHQHKQERAHFLEKLCPLTDQCDRGKFFTVQLEILYGRENHLYLCSACCNTRQINQAL